VHGPLMDYQSAHPDHVQVIFRHRPLYGIRGHETSETAAILSEIAAEQGKFWSFVDRLYREPHQLDQNGYLGLNARPRVGEARRRNLFLPILTLPRPFACSATAPWQIAAASVQLRAPCW